MRVCWRPCAEWTQARLDRAWQDFAWEMNAKRRGTFLDMTLEEAAEYWALVAEYERRGTQLALFSG
jgi:hypothetical protein